MARRLDGVGTGIVPTPWQERWREAHPERAELPKRYARLESELISLDPRRNQSRCLEIAEALVATALGLLAAIPAVIFYNKLSTDSDRIIGGYDAFADEFATILSRQLDA